MAPSLVDEWAAQRHLGGGSGEASYGSRNSLLGPDHLARPCYGDVFQLATWNGRLRFGGRSARSRTKHPDHDTTATFRRRSSSNRSRRCSCRCSGVAREIGVLKLGTVALQHQDPRQRQPSQRVVL